MEDFEAFVGRAWAEHAEQPAVVAGRLAAALDDVREPARIAPYVRLVTHVHGEHLGRWEEGIALLQQLPRAGDASEAAAAIETAIGTLRYCAGDEASVLPLAPADRAAALAAAAATLTGRNDVERAIAALDAARRTVPEDLANGAPAARALGVAGNNLAAALEEMADRSTAQTAAMVAAAETGLRYWRIAGTWLEEERAHYQLARSLLAAGRAADAVTAAQDCVDVCRANAAPPFEVFFGHAVLALARRAQGATAACAAARAAALAAYEQIPAGERSWCAADLAALDAAP